MRREEVEKFLDESPQRLQASNGGHAPEVGDAESPQVVAPPPQGRRSHECVAGQLTNS